MIETRLGSNFDDFLVEEEILAEVEATAIKRVLAFQIAQLMEEKNLSKTEMAKRMNTSRTALDRLLDPQNESATLQTLERAATLAVSAKQPALGKRLHIELV